MRNKNGPIVRLKNGAFKIELTDDHREVLKQLIEELRETLISSSDDAALRRLFPTAYNNDPQKDAEYQRLMRDELLASRLTSTETALKTIESKTEISEHDLDAFSRSINSMRLVIGTNLDISESDYGRKREESNRDDDADGETEIQTELYEYLGWLLEWTVIAQSEGL